MPEERVSGLADWVQLALEPTLVKRSTKIAVGVGTVLIAINQGDAFLRGDAISAGRFAKMALTYIVPYLVSTSAAISALRDRRDGADALLSVQPEPSEPPR